MISPTKEQSFELEAKKRQLQQRLESNDVDTQRLREAWGWRFVASLFGKGVPSPFAGGLTSGPRVCCAASQQLQPQQSKPETSTKRTSPNVLDSGWSSDLFGA